MHRHNFRAFSLWGGARALDALPRPYFSYNARFEMYMMEIELGMRVKEQDFVDIMKSWKERADNKAKASSGRSLTT